MAYKDLTWYQKTTLISLYALIILMLVFSAFSIRNVGEKGFNRCISKQCEKHGEDFCNKLREVSNCCRGATGSLVETNGVITCGFPPDLKLTVFLKLIVIIMFTIILTYFIIKTGGKK